MAMVLPISYKSRIMTKLIELLMFIEMYPLDALLVRNIGNELFFKKNFEAALCSYDEAIVSSSQESNLNTRKQVKLLKILFTYNFRRRIL